MDGALTGTAGVFTGTAGALTGIAGAFTGTVGVFTTTVSVLTESVGAFTVTVGSAALTVAVTGEAFRETEGALTSTAASRPDGAGVAGVVASALRGPPSRPAKTIAHVRRLYGLIPERAIHNS